MECCFVIFIVQLIDFHLELQYIEVNDPLPVLDIFKNCNESYIQAINTAINLEAAMKVTQAIYDSQTYQLGHLNYQQLHKMVDKKLATGMNIYSLADKPLCEHCRVGNMLYKQYKSADHKQSSK